MRKLFAWFLILVIIASAARIVLAYLLEKQSFRTYTKEQSYTVSLYFPNTVKDSKKEVCDLVFPYERTVIASKASLPLHTIELLFAGPNEAEKKTGAYTAIPPEAILAFFAITTEAIEIVVDYSEFNLDRCTETQLKSQIAQTLKQFNIPVPLEINPRRLIETIFVR
jgi:hypothetical protein